MMTDRVVASIDVGANPHGLAVSGDGTRVLVLGWGSNRALIIDTLTDALIAIPSSRQRITKSVVCRRPSCGRKASAC